MKINNNIEIGKVYRFDYHYQVPFDAWNELNFQLCELYDGEKCQVIDCIGGNDNNKIYKVKTWNNTILYVYENELYQCELEEWEKPFFEF